MVKCILLTHGLNDERVAVLNQDTDLRNTMDALKRSKNTEDGTFINVFYCECGMPDCLLDEAAKFLFIKSGCDLGSKLKSKCAKPLVVCCGKTVV